MIDDRVETTSERHKREERQRGRMEFRDEILLKLQNGQGVRSIQIQLLIIEIEAMT